MSFLNRILYTFCSIVLLGSCNGLKCPQSILDEDVQLLNNLTRIYYQNHNSNTSSARINYNDPETKTLIRELEKTEIIDKIYKIGMSRTFEYFVINFNKVGGWDGRISYSSIKVFYDIPTNFNNVENGDRRVHCKTKLTDNIFFEQITEYN